MTPNQQAKFIQIAQMGVACGLTTPEEWLLNYSLHQMNFEPLAEIPRNYELALEAYAAFWRGTASDPHEKLGFDAMSDYEIVDSRYRYSKLRP